jgi:hypothetical protein
LNGVRSTEPTRIAQLNALRGKARSRLAVVTPPATRGMFFVPLLFFDGANDSRASPAA